MALGLSLIRSWPPLALRQHASITGTPSPLRFTGTAGSFETTVPAVATAWPIANSNVFSGSPSNYFEGTTAASPSLNVYNAAGSSVIDTLAVLEDTAVSMASFGAPG